MFITRRNPLYLLVEDDGAGSGAAITPAPEGTPGTPTEPTTPAAATQEEIDWQKRAHDAQAWGTQTAQEAAELRRERELYQTLLTSEDPDARRQAAEALGFQIDDDDDDDGLVDPEISRLKREHEELKAWREEITQAGQTQQAFDRDVTHIGDGLRALQGTLGRELTQEEVQLLGDAAWQNRDEQGLPNIAAVAEMATPMLQAAQQSTQQRPRAPHIGAGGQAATQVPAYHEMNQDERHQAMARRLRDINAVS